LEIRAPQHIRIASGDGLGDWHDGEWMIARGCTRVSPGCENCTAEASLIDTPVAEMTEGGPRWTGVVEELPTQVSRTPRRWSGPLKLFVGASTDFWHRDISDGFREQVWDVCQRFRQHTYGFLTKRASEMRQWFERTGHVVPDNVWLGVTVETDNYRRRLDELLQIQARVRYAQCEPLLDRVHLKPYLDPSLINWVVAGPEWGCHDPRPCQDAWMRQLRDDCAAAGVPFFTKHLLDECEHRNLPI
jgi:protein gp37